MRKSVLLLAKTGFIIRDILLGKFTVELIKHMDLTASVPNPHDKRLITLLNNKRVTLISFRTRQRPKSRYQQYFGLQHWVHRFKQIERDNKSLDAVTRLFEPNLSGKRKKLVKLMLLTARTVKYLNLTVLSDEIFLTLVRKWEITKYWESVLKKIKPSVIVSTMLTLPDGFFSPSTDLPIILAAKKLHIPCGTLVQSWDNLSSKAYILPTWLDRYWTWSETMTEDLIRFNPRVKKERIRVVGCPHYDFHMDSNLEQPRDAFLCKLGLDPGRPYILIGTGVRKGLPDEPITISNLVRRLQQSNPEMQVLLRIHPKDDLYRWTEHIEQLRSMGVIIQKPVPSTPMDKGGFTPPNIFFREQVNVIKHASAVINIASSLTVDAAILDRPVISLGYDQGPDTRFPEGRAWFFNHSEHFEPLVKTGGVWVVWSEEECIEAINAYVRNPSLHKAGRKLIVEKVAGCVDGMAGVRLAKEVMNLAQ